MKKALHLIFLFLVLCTLSANAQLVISEISYNPPESGTDSLEYIELYNETSNDIDLAGYIIEDNNQDTILSGSVPANGYAILAINPTAIMTVLGVEAIEIERIATNNGGERIAILNSDGNLIDEVTYDDEGDWPTFEDGTDGAGATIELCDLTADNNDGNNWGVSLTDTGADVGGTPFFGTPNAENNTSCVFMPDHIVEVSNNIFTPADITINVGENIRWINVQGFHNVNGSLATYPDNPVGFANGAAASGAWTFDFTFDVPGVYDYQCDPHAGQGMVGTVTVVGEPEIPTYDIGIVNTVDADGVADSLSVQCTVEGVVHGANLRGDSGLQFALIDDSGDAIGLFSTDNLGYNYAEGDLIRATGFITQFMGLTQIQPNEITFVSSGNTLTMMTDVTVLNEDTESQLITTVPVRMIGEWPGDGGSFNVDFEAENGEIFDVRIDSDVDAASWEGPAQSDVYDIVITGIGSQFDSEQPLFDGYQMLPRSINDFSFILSTDNDLDISVNIFPNPVQDVLNVQTDDVVDTYTIYNNIGQEIQKGDFRSSINVAILKTGFYVLSLEKDGKIKALNFIK